MNYTDDNGFASISKSMLKMETEEFSTRKWDAIGAVLQIGDLQNRLRGDESFSGDGAGLLGESLVRRSALDPSYQQDSGRRSVADLTTPACPPVRPSRLHRVFSSAANPCSNILCILVGTFHICKMLPF